MAPEAELNYDKQVIVKTYIENAHVEPAFEMKEYKLGWTYSTM